MCENCYFVVPDNILTPVCVRPGLLGLHHSLPCVLISKASIRRQYSNYRISSNKAQVFISYNPLMNQLKNLVVPCSSCCWHTFGKSLIPIIVVMLVLEIKLPYTIPAPGTKVVPRPSIRTRPLFGRGFCTRKYGMHFRSNGKCVCIMM